MMNELLLENLKLEEKLVNINLDGEGELVKAMMSDLRWELFESVQEDEADYVVSSSNEYAKKILDNKDKFIEALRKAEKKFIKDVTGYDFYIHEYAIIDNSMDYLQLGLEFFEDMIG